MSCKCLLTPIFMAGYWPVKLFYLSEKWIQWIFQRNCSKNTPKNSNGSNVMDFIWNCKDYYFFFAWNFKYILLKLYFFFMFHSLVFAGIQTSGSEVKNCENHWDFFCPFKDFLKILHQIGTMWLIFYKRLMFYLDFIYCAEVMNVVKMWDGLSISILCNWFYSVCYSHGIVK